MKTRSWLSLLALALHALAGSAAATDEQSEPGARVLFLSKSSGYEHASIMRKNGQPSHVDRVLAALAREHGFELITTKDASLINAEELDRWDVVIFYTTGDLTRRGGDIKGLFAGDGNAPMAENGMAELLQWLRDGGGFVGYHCATDIFEGFPGTAKGVGSTKTATPYIDMIGGEFQNHGREFAGTLRIVDAEHPTMENVPADWTKLDEWYLFDKLDRERMHVLALLDPGDERQKQAIYDVPDYPIIWASSYGDGRVYYNAMGHRPDVWDDPAFQKSVVDAIVWAAGTGDAGTEPNFDRVVPAAKN